MSDYTTILYDDSVPPVARITLNRPDKRNPITPITVGEIIHALDTIRQSDAIRVVVITGAGKVFSAGGDLSAMSGRLGDGPQSPAGPRSLVDLFPAMHGLGKPVIAMVGGHALAGGMGLMVACDLVVASDKATFGLTEINVGLWPMMITAELVRNIGRKKTLELMLTGKRISAEEAAAIGLVNHVVPADELDAATSALAEQIAERSPAAIALGLRAFYATQDMDLQTGLRHLEGQLGKVLALDDATEGITAFLQKRKPIWKGR
ncbi:MAG: enoyl-CoA hydratase-related protein [Proteobacteria bacterium]|nr:enoyl-CoA hydratase-related protein [Pseudomonadota bacterium]